MKIKQKTEYNIGEVFAFGLKRLQCVSVESENYSCEKCIFTDQNMDQCPNNFTGPCGRESRSDKQDIIFVELKKE